MTTPLLVAVAGHTVAGVATAFVAAPAHGRLSRHGRTPALVQRLRTADRMRLLGTVLALGAAALL